MEQEVFNEMIYKPKSERLLLAQGTYNGLDYYVMSMGCFPCAYVDCKSIVTTKDNINNIDCHGGITFINGSLIIREEHKDANEVITGNFIGWDYAHFGDFTGDLLLTCRRYYLDC